MLHFASLHGTRAVLDILSGFDKVHLLDVRIVHHLPAHKDNTIADWADTFRCKVARELCHYIEQERQNKRWDLRGFSLFMESFEDKEGGGKVWRQKSETHAFADEFQRLILVPKDYMPFPYYREPFCPSDNYLIALAMAELDV